MSKLYKEIKNNQWVETARSLIRTILANNRWNITITSNILWCSRRTIEGLEIEL